MDGLPLAATLFRPFVSWLPADFHYFGLWHVIVVTLQAVAGAAFVRCAGVRHAIPCLCGALLALSMPIFVGRINWAHVALSTQGLLILTLALCVYASRKRPSLRFLFPRAAGLSLGTIAIHPLLALQVLLFSLLAVALSQSPRWHRAVVALALCLLFAALCQVLGIFTAASFASPLAVGEFGFSPLGMIVGEPQSLRDIYDARGPGIEQDAWLGSGCVFLLILGLVLRPRFRLPRGYYPLAGVIALLAIIAISPWVRIGTFVFDRSSLFPEAIIELYGIHRAAVRLAWPMVICLSLLPLAHFVKAWSIHRSIMLIGTAFMLQIYSVWPYWVYEYRDARIAVERLAPPPQVLEGGARLRVVEEIEGFPTGPRSLRYAMHLAVESGIPLEGGWFSRPPPNSRDDKGRELPSDQGATRYVAVAIHQGSLPTQLPQVTGPVTCVRWERLFVCRPE